jgi:hypothetical protein
MGFSKLASHGLGAVCAAALVACGGGGGDARVAPTISVQPQSQQVLTDAIAVFSVTATGSALTYQWFRNGSPIAGATASTYTTPAVTYLDHDAQYSVVVSNADGSTSSAAARLSLRLSSDQQAFERLSVGADTGGVRPRWNLNLAGPQASGVNYAYSEQAGAIVSPLTNGPQVSAVAIPQNMARSLALIPAAPVRVLKNGSILVVPSTLAATRISYVGSSVQVQALAADNMTPAYTQTHSDFSFVPLSGALGSTPSELAQWLNSFFANPAVLNGGAAYASGAGYLKFNAVSKGDRYDAFDCAAITTDANISPCVRSTSLEAALADGIVSGSDERTYRLADGAITMVSGVPVWVASSARPVSATLSSTVQYRTYFQLNGNVYTGALIKDGATLGGSYWVSNRSGATVEERLTFLPYQIRLNKAARDSIAGAMAI